MCQLGPTTGHNATWFIDELYYGEGQYSLEVIAMARKPRLGSGKRFANLKRSLARKGVRNPGAVAASIGRKKYGAKRMSQLSAAGRRRKARSR